MCCLFIYWLIHWSIIPHFLYFLVELACLWIKCIKYLFSFQKMAGRIAYYPCLSGITLHKSGVNMHKMCTKHFCSLKHSTWPINSDLVQCFQEYVLILHFESFGRIHFWKMSGWIIFEEFCLKLLSWTAIKTLWHNWK